MNKIDFKHKVFNLSERLFPMVARMLGSHSKAQDALQDIMMKLWSKRRQLAKHPNINGFVFLTARNYCLDILRKKSPVLDDSMSYLNAVGTSGEHNELEWIELNKIVIKILQSLPKQQKEVFTMRDLDGLEFKEIACALDITIDYSRVLLSRARKHISYELENTYRYEKGRY